MMRAPLRHPVRENANELKKDHFPASCRACRGLCFCRPALAQEYVPFGPRPSTEGVPEGEWVGGVRLTYGNDDNVAQASDTRLFFVGEEDATFARAEALARYWTTLGNGMRFGTVVMGSYTHYADVNGGNVVTDSLNWYSNGSIHAEVFLETDVETGFGLLTIAPSYAIRAEQGDDRVAALGLISHQLAVDASLAMTDTLSLHAGAAVAFNNYDVVFALASRDRDAVLYEVYGGATIPVFGFAPFDVEIALQENDSDGSDWAWSGVELRLDRSFLITEDLLGSLSLDYGWRDYDTVAFTDLDPAGRGDQEFLRAGLGVDYLLTDTTSVGAYISHLDVIGDNAAFAYDRTEMGITLTMRFQ